MGWKGRKESNNVEKMICLCEKGDDFKTAKVDATLIDQKVTKVKANWTAYNE